MTKLLLVPFGERLSTYVEVPFGRGFLLVDRLHDLVRTSHFLPESCSSSFRASEESVVGQSTATQDRPPTSWVAVFSGSFLECPQVS